MEKLLETITKYRQARGWTEYQLAEKPGLPQSTISSWYRKNMIPTVPSLEKICNAFGITLSQLFSKNEEAVTLTKEQKDFLKAFSRLNEEQQKVIFDLMNKM